MSEVGQSGGRAVGQWRSASNTPTNGRGADQNLLPDRPTARLPASILAVIFDWGRTLWDSDTGTPFPDVVPVLDYLAPRYRLAIVSLATGPDHAARVAERQAAIAAHGLARYFDPIIFAAADKDRCAT